MKNLKTIGIALLLVALAGSLAGCNGACAFFGVDCETASPTPNIG